MATKLRDFQENFVNEVERDWDAGAINVCGVAPTGAGKTVVIAHLMDKERGASAAIAHRQELVTQIATALGRNGVSHRIIGANKNSALIRVASTLQVLEFGHSYVNPNAKVGVGGVDTIVRMDKSDPWFKQVRLQVHDECHHVVRDNKWGKVAAMFPNARGFFPTATPVRADGKGLGRHADGIMDSMVLAPSMREIIDMGFLTDYKVFLPPSSFKRENIAVSATTGDFNQDANRKAVHEAQITGDIVGQYMKLARGKLGATFAVDIEEATKYAQAFRAAGIPAEVVSGITPANVRAEILARFKRREILQVTSCDVLGEGYDLPALEVVQFARPTQSFGLFTQQFGRVLRLMLTPEHAANWNSYTPEQRKWILAGSSKPFGLVIDHVGNVMQHGVPDSPQQWSLDGRERRGGGGSAAIPTTVCTNDGCFKRYERIHPCCPYCGFKPEPQERSAPKFVDGDLMEVSREFLLGISKQIQKIDGDFYAPAGLPAHAAHAARYRHDERRAAQRTLRNSIAWWAGLQHAQGYSESQAQRLFFHKYGVDIATAQTLGSTEAADLINRINNELTEAKVDVSYDAVAHFATNGMR